MSTTSPPFDEVYRLHHDKVFRFCLTQLGNRAVAEDVCSDVFTNAYAAYERTRPGPDGVVPWLFRIARNGIIDHARRKARWGTLLMSVFSAPRTTIAPEDVTAVREGVRLILAAMQSLRPRDRELIGLRVVGEMGFDEIGHVMRISPRAAEVATRRAREKLAAILQQDYHVEPAWAAGEAR